MATARKPRFKHMPEAVPAGFRITERDLAILRLVARLRFARSTHVVAAIRAMQPEASAQKIIRRLELLYHSAHLERPAAQQESYRAGAGSSPMVYMLGAGGADLLSREFGFRRMDWTFRSRTISRGEITHALEVSDFLVAFEVACRRRGTLDVIHFDDILRELAPAETRNSQRPYHWPVSARVNGHDEELYVIPDRTFGLRDGNRPEGQNRKFFFLEADRGTMPVVRNTLSQSSIVRKLIGYGATYKGEHHKRVYGLPNFRVLTVVPGRKRIDTILDAYRQHAASFASPRLFLFAERTGLLSA